MRNATTEVSSRRNDFLDEDTSNGILFTSEQIPQLSSRSDGVESSFDELRKKLRDGYVTITEVIQKQKAYEDERNVQIADMTSEIRVACSRADKSVENQNPKMLM